MAPNDLLYAEFLLQNYLLCHPFTLVVVLMWNWRPCQT